MKEYCDVCGVGYFSSPNVTAICHDCEKQMRDKALQQAEERVWEKMRELCISFKVENNKLCCEGYGDDLTDCTFDQCPARKVANSPKEGDSDGNEADAK